MSRIRPIAAAMLLAIGISQTALAGNPCRVTEPPLMSRYPKPAKSFGFPGDTYRWGWFGTKYYPHVAGHAGYYGRDMQWSVRRGY